VVEAIFSLLAIRDGVVPPTINLHNPGPDCDLDYVPNTGPRKLKVDIALSNSFGFGRQPMARSSFGASPARRSSNGEFASHRELDVAAERAAALAARFPQRYPVLFLTALPTGR